MHKVFREVDQYSTILMKFLLFLVMISICQEALAITKAQINYILNEPRSIARNAYYFDERGMLNNFCVRYYPSDPPKDWKPDPTKKLEYNLNYFFSQISPEGKETVIKHWKLREEIFDINIPYGFGFGFRRVILSGSKFGGYVIIHGAGGESGTDFQVVWLDETGRIRTKSKLFNKWPLPRKYNFCEGDEFLYLVYEMQAGSVIPDLYYSVLKKDTLINYTQWKNTEPICGQKFHWFHVKACELTDDSNILIGDVVTKEFYSHDRPFWILRRRDRTFEDIKKNLFFFVVNSNGEAIRKTNIVRFEEVACRKYPDVLLLNIEMVRLGNGQIAAYIPTFEEGKPYVYEVRLTGNGEIIRSETCQTVSAEKITALPKGRWAKVETYYHSYTDYSRPGAIIYGFDEQGNLYYHHGILAERE